MLRLGQTALDTASRWAKLETDDWPLAERKTVTIQKPNKPPLPELLAPAGGPEQLRAAVENGADAVYLGLQGFNARAGATNFTGDELRAGIAYAHGRGVNMYLTLNTLVADSEMAAAVDAAGSAWLAGADALIVQDLGLAKVLRAHLPQLPLHMSTQGTVTSLEDIRALLPLGFERFILARELPLDRVAAIAQASPTPVEVFVHGALCVCYSGQCQMSSMIGGRSGNRGRCAQPCRLPQALRNGDATGIAIGAKPVIAAGDEHRRRSGGDRCTTDARTSCLSPRDLCTLDLLPALVGAGVGALKIEGRLKSPEYVAIVTDVYRKALDTIAESGFWSTSSEDSAALEQVFNRGFTLGWLGGHQGNDLVDGGPPGHRGVPVGHVVARRGTLLDLELTAPLHRGDSLEVRADAAADSAGMLVTFLQQNGNNVEAATPGRAVVGDFSGSVANGDTVFRMADRTLNDRARHSFEGIRRRSDIHGRFDAAVGAPLFFEAWDDAGHSAFARSQEPAQAARTQPLTVEAVREQLEKTGPWPFRLADCEVTVDGIAAAPKSALNALRREVMDSLLTQREQRSTERIGFPLEGKLSPKATDEVVYQMQTNTSSGASHHLPLKGKALTETVTPQLSVVLTRWRPELAGTLSGIPRVFVPLDDWLAHDMPGNVFPRIPFYVDLSADRPDAVAALQKRRPALALCGSAGHAGVLRQYGVAIWADQSLNAYNGATLAALDKLGFAGATLSPELTLKQVQAINRGDRRQALAEHPSPTTVGDARLPVGNDRLSSYVDAGCVDIQVAWASSTSMARPAPQSLQLEAIVYGRLPLMTTRHCPLGRNKSGCKACSTGSHMLTDRKGMEFPLAFDARAHVCTILNADILAVPQLAGALGRAGISWLRLYIHDESAEQVAALLAQFSAAARGEDVEPLAGKGYTKGHYFRGV